MTGFRNTSATHITIPSTVVYDEWEGYDEEGHSIVKHRTCRVTGIWHWVFSDCSGLTSVTIPDSVTDVGYWSFYGCSGLTNMTILGNITNDWNYFSDNYRTPFYACTNILMFVLGGKMTKIGNYMFSGCSAATNFVISASITNIGEHAFDECGSLKAFSVANDNPAYKSVAGLLLTKDGKALIHGVNGDVVIPDGVTDVGDYAFHNCVELTSVKIPDSVERLATTAFDGCDKLWTSWYRTLANLAAGGGSSGGISGGSSGGNGKTVSLTVTNVVVHYVTQSVPSGAVTPATNSTGIVNIVAEVTAGKAIAISEDWAKQYPGFAAKYGTDFSAALTMPDGKRDGTGAPMQVWQDYVAGTDPTDPASVFTASVTFDAETGEPVISWSPELSPEEAAKRLYTIYGKVRVTDPDWLPLSGDASAYNFYRVTVEMK